MAKKKTVVNDLPSNSISSRVAPIRESRSTNEEIGEIKEKPRRRPVVRGRVIRQKKSLSRSIAEAFIGNGSDSVGGYILQDVMVPALKNLVNDAVTSAIEMLLYGESTGRSRSRGRDRDKSIINYGSFSRRDRDEDRREHRRPATYRNKFDLDEIYFRDHEDAEEVLSGLCDRLEDFDEVSVADYFDLAGITGITHVHYKWGWTDLRHATNTHTRHGWAINLPDPEPLD